MRLIGMKESPKREEVFYYVELESKEELAQYFSKFNEEFKRFFEELIKSDYSVKRWDHVQVKGVAAACFYSSVVKMKIDEVSPYQAINEMESLKHKIFNETLERYGSVCVSLLMGTCRPPFDENDIVVSNQEIKVLPLEEMDYSDI